MAIRDYAAAFVPPRLAADLWRSNANIKLRAPYVSVVDFDGQYFQISFSAKTPATTSIYRRLSDPTCSGIANPSSNRDQSKS
jgi:hypothetical protein